MKSLEEFNKLKIEEKIFLLFESGYEIATNIEDGSTILKLYALLDFFAEVRYVANSNKIESIITISADDMFRKYSERIDISDLFND